MSDTVRCAVVELIIIFVYDYYDVHNIFIYIFIIMTL